MVYGILLGALICFQFKKNDIHYQTSNSQLLELFAKISFDALKNIDDILEQNSLRDPK